MTRRGWEITAYADRRGNRWRVIGGQRLQLVSQPHVRLGKAVVELDYGPLRPTEVDDLGALVDECERWRAEVMRLRGNGNGANPTTRSA